MTLLDQAQPAFARHETFYPRYGWLRKAFDAALFAPDVFTRPEATVILGVGKNMVNAIRYWGLAFKVLEERRNPKRPRMPEIIPSAFGMSLFSDDGYDPFVENPGTVWLLHWQLLRPPCLAPVWWLAFNGYPSASFTEESLSSFAMDQVRSVPGWPTPLPSSVARDISCMLLMYAPRNSRNSGLEDLINSPFRELGLIASTGNDSTKFRFIGGPKPHLPDEIIGFASLDYVARTTPGAQTITVNTLASAPGGPGRAFKVGEAVIFAALARLSPRFASIAVAEPAGIKQLLIQRDPGASALKVLESFYKRVGNFERARALSASLVPEASPMPTSHRRGSPLLVR